MDIPLLSTNADEVAARIGSLRCELGVMRGALRQAEERALEGFSGPEAQAFVERCAAVTRLITELESSLAGLPEQVRGAGDQIVHARRDALAASLGPGARLVDGVAERLGW